MYRPIHLPIYLSTYLPIHLSTYLSIYLPTYLSIYLSIYGREADTAGGGAGRAPVHAFHAVGLAGGVDQLVDDGGVVAVEEKCRLHQLRRFSSKRLQEKWHNWYSTAHFLNNTATPLFLYSGGRCPR